MAGCAPLHVVVRLARISILALVPAAAAATAAGAIAISEFPLTSKSSGPNGITVGADGNLWFIEAGTGKIGRMSLAGAVTGEFPVSSSTAFESMSSPGITTGADGNVWFTEPLPAKVGRITPAGMVTEFQLAALSQPTGITRGPDGNVWVAEYQADKIARITPGGMVDEFPVPTASAAPYGITTGPDGNLWFTEDGAAKVGRMTTSGVVQEFPCPNDPDQIVAGLDGNLWFTFLFAHQINRITPSGAQTSFATTAAAGGIARGPGGNLWFVEGQGDAIGTITLAGVVSEFPLPTSGALPDAIVTGPDGNVWFTEGDAGQIGRAIAPCVAGGETLCVDDQPCDRRWQITSSFSTAEGGGHAGQGQAISLASLGVTHGGLFWFFGIDNPEMLVKVLDGCAVNEHFWVFAAATTNVGFVLSVKDTATGNAKSYTNHDGTAAKPVQDTSALPCS
jgi:streptogramin lyase